MLGGLNPANIHEKLKQDKIFEKHLFSYFKDIIHHHLPDIEVVVNKKYESCTENPPHLLEETDSKKPQIGKILWILRLRYLAKFLNVTSAWRCAINMEIKISVGFNFPMREPESYFDANTNSVILKCIDSMVNYFNKCIQYTVCKL